jgi:DNA polymerase-3 subunit epsilon
MEIALSALRLAAIDFESLPDPHGSHFPVQIGIALGSWTTFEGSWESPLSDAALAGAKDAPEHAPRLLELWPRVRESLAGRWILAHGIGTEKRFLRAFPGHRFGPWIDTLRWSRAVYPTMPSHSLSDLCEALGVAERLRAEKIPGTWHDARFDAIACLFLIQHVWRETGIVFASKALLTSPDLSPYFRATKK